MTYSFYSRTYDYQYEQQDNSFILFWLFGGLLFLLVLILISALISERRLDRLERIQDHLLLDNRIKQV